MPRRSSHVLSCIGGCGADEPSLPWRQRERRQEIYRGEEEVEQQIVLLSLAKRKKPEGGREIKTAARHRKMSSPAHNRSSANNGRHGSEPSGLARGNSPSSSSAGISSMSVTGGGSSYDSRNFMMSSVAPPSAADTSTTSDGHFTSIGMQPQMIPTISGDVPLIFQLYGRLLFAHDRKRVLGLTEMGCGYIRCGV